MRHQSLTLALSLLATSATALQRYALRAQSSSDILNGRNINSAINVIGIYDDNRDPMQFTTVQVAHSDFVELHSYPIGTIDTRFALVGDINDVLDFEVIDPIGIPAGSNPTVVSDRWFVVPEGGGELGWNDVKYSTRKGGFYAYVSPTNPEAWVIKWRADDSTSKIGSFVPITIQAIDLGSVV